MGGHDSPLIGRRLVGNAVLSKADAQIARYQAAIGELKSSFLDRAAVVTETVVIRIADDLEDVSARLAELGMFRCCWSTGSFFA